MKCGSIVTWTRQPKAPSCGLANPLRCLHPSCYARKPLCAGGYPSCHPTNSVEPSETNTK